MAPYAAFGAFGVFWGAWGAALPALRTQGGVSEGELGTALLFVGLGALPTMALTGRAVDRFGLRVAAWLLMALAGAGLLITAGADGMVRLTLGMLVVGAASGAADVAINTLAGRAEHVADRPLLTRPAGLFSVGVVVASLATGGLLGAGLSLLSAFVIVAAVMLVLAVVALVTLSTLHLPDRHENAEPRGFDGLAGSLRGFSLTSPLLVVGLVAALAYAIENAHQSWGAVILTDTFTASPQLAAAAPATFAASAALARLTLAPLSRSHPTAVLVGGGGLATAGCTVLATAPSVGVALAGLVLAALGTATLFPTLLSRSLRGTDPPSTAGPPRRSPPPPIWASCSARPMLACSPNGPTCAARCSAWPHSPWSSHWRLRRSAPGPPGDPETGGSRGARRAESTFSGLGQ